MSVPLRLGVICSSSGGVLDALARRRSEGDEPWRIASVITDRRCGAERVCGLHRLDLLRLEDRDPTSFSAAASEHFRSRDVDVALLLFARRVDAALWRDAPFPTWNLHPSLLPRHRGLGALEASWEDARRRGDAERATMGVTLHEVDRDLDGGPVLGQGRIPWRPDLELDEAGHLVYLHKVAVVIAALRAHHAGPLTVVPQGMVDRLPWRGAFRGVRPSADLLELVAALARPGTAPPWPHPQEVAA